MVPSVPKISLGGKNIFGFPPTLQTRLRYCDTVPITCTSGALGKYVFQVNSLFDPDFTGTGHQPLYRDTFSAIYDSYAVVSARVRARMVNTANIPAHCGVVFEDDTTASTSYNVLMEQNTGQHWLLPSQSGSLSSHSFSINWSCEKMLGIDPYHDQSYKSAFGSNPTVLGALCCWIQPVDLATTATYYLNIEIDQLVYLSDLATPTVS